MMFRMFYDKEIEKRISNFIYQKNEMNEIPNTIDKCLKMNCQPAKVNRILCFQDY